MHKIALGITEMRKQIASITISIAASTATAGDIDIDNAIMFHYERSKVGDVEALANFSAGCSGILLLMRESFTKPDIVRDYATQHLLFASEAITAFKESGYNTNDSVAMTIDNVYGYKAHYYPIMTGIKSGSRLDKTDQFLSTLGVCEDYASNLLKN